MDVQRLRLLRHRSRVVTDVCARVPGRFRVVPVVVQALDRPSFEPHVAQVQGRPSCLPPVAQALCRPRKSHVFTQVLGHTRETCSKQCLRRLSARSQEVCAVRASRLNGALALKNELLPAPWDGLRPFHPCLCSVSCRGLCPCLSRPCSSLHSMVSSSCPARSGCLQNSGILDYRSGESQTHVLCFHQINFINRVVMSLSMNVRICGCQLF